MTVCDESGFDLKRYCGKVFQKDIIKVVQELSVVDQVRFKVKRTESGDRRYTEFTKMIPKKFCSRNKCGQKIVKLCARHWCGDLGKAGGVNFWNHYILGTGSKPVAGEVKIG